MITKTKETIIINGKDVSDEYTIELDWKFNVEPTKENKEIKTSEEMIYRLVSKC